MEKDNDRIIEDFIEYDECADAYECLECGYNFLTYQICPNCPNCGSSDVIDYEYDLDELEYIDFIEEYEDFYGELNDFDDNEEI